MKTKRNKHVLQKRTTLRASQRESQAQKAQQFTEHLRELRRRLAYVAISVIGWSTVAYFVQQHIVGFLLKPAGHQQFIYTSPGGGMNFLVSVCLNTGIVMSIPVIIYNVLKFIEPLLHESSTRFIRRMSIAAALLALAGMAFGYYLGLPHTLQFLSQQFETNQIKALIAIQSYMAFVTKFLAGSAFIFQAPLILLLINRIKPLKPRSLFKYERWVILASCILGGVLSPTPDIRPMLLLSLPMIVMYQIGIGIIWRVNAKGRRSRKILELFEQDLATQAERLQTLQQSMLLPLQLPQLEPVPVPVSTEPLEQNPSDGYTPPVSVQQEEPSVPVRVVRTMDMMSGRRNYALSTREQRVQRRIML